MKKFAVLLVAVLAMFSAYTAASAAEEKVGFVDEMAVLQQFLSSSRRSSRSTR